MTLKLIRIATKLLNFRCRSINSEIKVLFKPKRRHNACAVMFPARDLQLHTLSARILIRRMKWPALYHSRAFKPKQACLLFRSFALPRSVLIDISTLDIGKFGSQHCF